MIRRRLDIMLKKRGRSLYWLAKEAGVSEQALSNFMKAKTKGIEFETLNRICEILECQPGDILIYDSNEDRDQKNRER
jgi:putative transcriptional regulator